MLCPRYQKALRKTFQTASKSRSTSRRRYGIKAIPGAYYNFLDKSNEAVMAMVKMAISTFKANGRKIGICGQAPSDYPEFARFLVEQGIDSISLNPDSVIKTRLEIAKVEASM